MYLLLFQLINMGTFSYKPPIYEEPDTPEGYIIWWEAYVGHNTSVKYVDESARILIAYATYWGVHYDINTVIKDWSLEQVLKFDPNTNSTIVDIDAKMQMTEPIRTYVFKQMVLCIYVHIHGFEMYCDEEEKIIDIYSKLPSYA